jgi:hypothetical protein
MSSTPIGPGYVSGAAVPPPLDLSSPDLGPSQSWHSRSGVIPIFLDPSLAASPSEETLVPCTSDPSLRSASSDLSVGTFGPMKRHQLQPFGDLASNDWRNVAAGSRVRSESYNIHHALSSPLQGQSPLMCPGSSGSTSSSTIASLPPTSSDEEETFYEEEDSVFTISAYFRGSSSLYDNADEDKVIPGSSNVDGAAVSQHDCSFAASASPPEGSVITNAVHRHVALRRKKSELDVPLSPTSTLLLSPSVSISSQIQPSRTAAHLSVSTTYSASNRQHIHYRAASAPLSRVFSPTYEADAIENSMGINNMASARPRGISQSSISRRFRSVSSSSEFYGSNSMMRSTQRTSCGATPDSFLGLPTKTLQDDRKIIAITRQSTRSSDAPLWIRSNSVELWIDQEGFRSIQPKFDLVEYWRGTGLSPSGQPLDVAEFLMKRPQSWHFHYAVRCPL